jgi:hypothetical protein
MCGLVGTISNTYGTDYPGSIAVKCECPVAPGKGGEVNQCRDVPDPSETVCSKVSSFRKREGQFCCDGVKGVGYYCALAVIPNPLSPGSVIPVNAVCGEMRTCYFVIPSTGSAHCEEAESTPSYRSAQTPADYPCDRRTG